MAMVLPLLTQSRIALVSPAINRGARNLPDSTFLFATNSASPTQFFMHTFMQPFAGVVRISNKLTCPYHLQSPEFRCRIVRR